MFLKKLLNLKGTLSFRLTLWYTVIFIFSSLLALSIFYYRISTITMERTDAELLEEMEEFSELRSEEDLEQVKAEMASEVESEDEEIFYRLLSVDGQVLAMSSTQPWGKLEVPEKILRDLRDKDSPVLRTLNIPNYEYKVRTIYGFISPTEVFQFGLSLEHNEEYLEVFRNLLFLLMIPLFVFSALIGWFMSRQALQGVEEVTLTAIDISKGSYDKRVQVKRRSYEVDRLANTFNSMLDRIQALLKSMREMTDNIAHDLRSPLTRIRGIAEMTLFSKNSIKDYENMAASTVEECDNLIEMINTMLDITETEAGVGEFNIEKVNLSKLIQDACELFRPAADEKGVNIITILPDKLHCQGDSNKLQRLVTNLLENSIKYTEPEGSVTISASLDNGQVNIVFEDTGIGISEKDLPKIFERFYRCDVSRTEAGIGLGLSLAKAIANAFGGDIRVKSAMNKGSSFLVTLPN
jgi:signal transduction histidine kinase